MAKLKIKKNDLVQVISGRVPAKGGDRGKQGRVIQVFPETNRVLVEGINRVTKHTKAGGDRGVNTGGIQVTEAPIHISNVAIVDPETKKPSRVGVRVEQVTEDGRTKTQRVRFAVRSGKDL
ncbi:MAG: 50S ribosomal protein L24 [Ornithinimicrobium sp.]